MRYSVVPRFRDSATLISAFTALKLELRCNRRPTGINFARHLEPPRAFVTIPFVESVAPSTRDNALSECSLSFFFFLSLNFPVALFPLSLFFSRDDSVVHANFLLISRTASRWYLRILFFFFFLLFANVR